MKGAFAIAVLLAGVTQASATGGISCSSAEGAATVEITTGHVDGLAVVGALLDVDGVVWAMHETGEHALAVSQAFTTGGHYWIDFADGNVANIVAELRLHRVDEGELTGFGGTLRMSGIGAWTLICSEG